MLGQIVQNGGADRPWFGGSAHRRTAPVAGGVGQAGFLDSEPVVVVRPGRRLALRPRDWESADVVVVFASS